MGNDKDIHIIINTLKKQMKLHGVTYRDAADKLELSEISIKRIFSKYECSLTRLNALCKLVKSSLLEITELARLDNESVDYFLTNDQENYFVKAPFHFYLFRLLYRGIEVEKVIKRFNMSHKEIFIILRDFERLGLIEIYPNNKITFNISGKIRLNLKGPLFNKLIKKQNTQFLEQVYIEHEREDCCLQSSEIQLSKKSITEFVQEINDLGRKYRKVSFYEEKLNHKLELFDVRWLMAFMPYESDWHKYR